MFAGEYLCKVDEKGRFIVPPPIREQLETEGTGVVFLKGPEQSLWIYSSTEWVKGKRFTAPNSVSSWATIRFQARSLIVRS